MLNRIIIIDNKIHLLLNCKKNEFLFQSAIFIFNILFNAFNKEY